MTTPTTYKPGMYETEFSPLEAERILLNTSDTQSNFRQPTRRTGTPNIIALTYADAMETGRWTWRDAAPIRLHYTSDGSLVCSDGLHRLTACSVSGEPLRSVVWVGEEYIAGHETDRGTARTFSQLLKSQGATEHVTMMASATRVLMLIALSVETNSQTSDLKRMIHHDDMLDVFQENRDVMTGCSHWASRLSHKHHVTSSGSLAFIVAAPPEDRSFISTATENPENQPIGDPWVAAISTARNYKLKSGLSFKSPVTFDMLVRAHEAWSAGTSTPGYYRMSMTRPATFPVGVDHRQFLPRSLRNQIESTNKQGASK